MCMFTVLEKLDLNGKNTIPFCTNEGSGMGSSEEELKNIRKGADVKTGLSIHGAESGNSENKPVKESFISGTIMSLLFPIDGY